MAEEVIKVDASSATVREWFNIIEKQSDIVLSYNPSLINMNARCKFERAREISVRNLIDAILEGYDYKLVTLPERKLLIQIERELFFDLTGVVKDADSKEKLMGATITVIDNKGKKTYSVSDRNGVFNVHVRKGKCSIGVSYVGFHQYENKTLIIDRNRFLDINMQPVRYALKEVRVKKRNSIDELSELAPSNLISFSSTDLFSQIRILPGVAVSSANIDFHVNGGSSDENLFLLDGFPIYNPGHINSMLTVFNGDAIKSVSFYKSFIPTEYEGRLSSVTSVRLKDGNKQKFSNTLSLDMPSASAVFEGPIIKNRLSYLISGRRSWLDFFDNIMSEEDRTNHNFYDFNVKLSCDLDSTTSIDVSTYNSSEDYHIRDEENKDRSMLRWYNQLYSLRLNTIISSKVINNTAVAYSAHSNSTDASLYGFQDIDYIRSRMRNFYATSEFTYNPGNLYTAHWGLKLSYDKFEMISYDKEIRSKWEPITQLSLFYDSHIRLTDRLYTQIGANCVFYIPKNHKRYSSIQPRFSLKYSIGDNNLLFANFSRMEQFFHHITILEIATPFDFIMPSINNFMPSTATHYETGWKHFFESGAMEMSIYYKRRNNILALSPNSLIDVHTLWPESIMIGKGDSYGISLYMYNRWRKFNLQCAYTFSRSFERFDELKERGEVPSLYDTPHIFDCALSYDIGNNSMLSLGGNMRSGRILPFYFDYDEPLYNMFRRNRDKTRYRIDASYSYMKENKKTKLLMRLGLYNILGNPSEEEMSYFFSIKIKKHCVPYCTITFKF